MQLLKNKYFLISVLAILNAGCALSDDTKPDSIITAQPYLGLTERQDRAELKELTGVDPVRVEWCAAFVNAVLELDNIPGSDSVSNYPLTARSFLTWGNKVDPADIQRGDIVVFPRGNAGWQGHVGFFVEEQNGQWVILGGNQNNEVRYDLYNPRRAISIRRYINTAEGEDNDKMGNQKIN
jgi:uncharacterized protein (TIGR02594 family)